MKIIFVFVVLFSLNFTLASNINLLEPDQSISRPEPDQSNLINQSDEYKKAVCNMQNQTPGSEALGNKIHNQVKGQMSQNSKKARKANNKGKAQQKQPEAISLIDLTTTNKTTDTTDTGQKSNKRTKVTVVGDSQLRLDENKLCNQN